MPLHYPTLVKARLLGTASYLDTHYIQYFKTDLFKEFGIHSKNQGWEILRHGVDRRHLEHETRGQKPIISADDLRRMEEIIWQYGFQARSLTWQGLAMIAGIQASARTVERAMGTLKYRKCIACEKGFVSLSNAKRRVKAAKLALYYRPRPED